MRQLLGSPGPGVDAHADDAHLRMRTQGRQLLQEGLGREDVEHRRLQRNDQAVGEAQRTLQGLAGDAGRIAAAVESLVMLLDRVAPGAEIVGTLAGAVVLAVVLMLIHARRRRRA